jgi:hypothetical protein
MDPPQINRHKMPRSRLNNNSRKKINEYGIQIPSNNVKNYEPSLGETAMLLSSGNLPGSTRVRYNVNAKARRNNAWETYLRKWTNAKARETKKNKNRIRNNGTRRTLF